ncbi:MAG: ABC transporter permease subunit [Phycisphaerales bacterium]|nr:ABC transporter permease subunit [Phycisphaerales bacterium]
MRSAALVAGRKLIVPRHTPWSLIRTASIPRGAGSVKFLSVESPLPTVLYRFLRLSVLNPICLRIVENASRRHRHLYLRGAYLALLSGVLLIGMLAVTADGGLSLRELAAGSAGVFVWLAILQLVLICVLTPVFMAGAIAKEAEPRTWDILLSTPLSPLQIVLGNLLGRLFFIAALLLAAIPLMAVTQFFGGVPGRVIFLTQLVAACLALVVGASAVARSVRRTASRRAVIGFFVVTLLYLVTTIVADRLLRQPAAMGTAWWTTWVTPLNPFLVLEVLLQPGTHLIPEQSNLPLGLGWATRHPVAAWCWLCAGVSLLLVLWSSFRVRRMSDAPHKASAVRRFQAAFSGAAASDSGFSGGSLSGGARSAKSVRGNPIAWRERVTRHRDATSAVLRWGFVVVGVVLAIIALSLHGTGTISGTTFNSIVLVLVGIELIIVTFAAMTVGASAIAREREDGSLDLLLTTSITPADYLRGKVHGIIMLLLPMAAVPCLTLMATGLEVLIMGTTVALPSAAVDRPGQDIPLVLWEAAIATPLVVLPYLAFTVAVGLLWSMRSRGTVGAIVTTIAVVLPVTVALGFCLVPASDMGHIGSLVAALSPLNFLLATIDPTAPLDSIMRSDPSSAGMSLVIGAVIGGCVWSLLTWGLLRGMTTSFVMTVRRLAGV